MKNILSKVGQVFIIGFEGEKPDPAFLDFVAETQIGGVILFESNCPTFQVAADNINLIKKQYRSGVPLIAIDQEGGRVCRLRGAPAEIESASSYGDKGDIASYHEALTRSMVSMKSLGINLNLAPVADIFVNPENSCLKDRCFGDSPETVSRFVECAVDVARQNQMLCCLKHFPGLGASTVDPHSAVAEAEYDEMIWEQREMLPFAAGIAKGADMVMTTHLRLPSIDNKIVTESKKIIRNLLRNRLAFDGPLITDDLAMEGAAGMGGIGDRAKIAFGAGHDILLMGQDFEAATIAYEHFMNSVERGEISSERLGTSVNRIAGMKFKLESSVLR